jgi:hypothetical protein
LSHWDFDRSSEQNRRGCATPTTGSSSKVQ